MSSAFGRRPADEPQPSVQPQDQGQPTELTGDEAEPLLAEAASSGDTAAFLQTLLCASVILPIGDPEAAHLRVGDPAFRWASDIVDGIIGITVYTTIERMAERAGEDIPHTVVPFGWLIQHWPAQDYALYVNPGTSVGANMCGPEIEPLIKWAEAKDLLTFATEMEKRQAAAARAESPSHKVQPILWQKTIPHQQVPFYLDRGYDRVGGFIHPAEAVDHLRTPAQLYLALGLMRLSEEFSPADDSVHVLRWIGYRTDLYPTAIGGNDFATAESRGGTVVEPGPFRGDGFAPSEGDERIPEHKVDSVRLPHGAKILRIDSRGEVTELALYDADTREWTPIDGAFGGPAAIEAPSTPALPAGLRLRRPAAERSDGRGLRLRQHRRLWQCHRIRQCHGYDSALGEAWGDADGHYDLVRPKPEERAASVLDPATTNGRTPDARRLHRPLEGRRIRLQSRRRPRAAVLADRRRRVRRGRRRPVPARRADRRARGLLLRADRRHLEGRAVLGARLLRRVAAPGVLRRPQRRGPLARARAL